MDPGAPARRLVWWLRIWGAIFALGAADFLVLPAQTVRSLIVIGRRLGFGPATELAAPGFWVPLAAAYMILIAAFCFDGQRGGRPAERPVRYLLLAKVSSAGAALGWFFLGGLAFPFLAAGVVDALIAAGTLALLRASRPLPV